MCQRHAMPTSWGQYPPRTKKRRHTTSPAIVAFAATADRVFVGGERLPPPTFHRFECVSFDFSFGVDLHPGNPHLRLKKHVETSGNKWQQVATSGNKWQQVETSGNTWKQVETSGNKWKQVPTSGNKGKQQSISMHVHGDDPFEQWKTPG